MPTGYKKDLTDKDKNDIKEMYNNYISSNEISKIYKISTDTVKKIVGKLRNYAESSKIGSLKRKNIVTDETKLKISQGMKKAHLEGRHPGWTINSDSDRRSYPEKFFLKLLNQYNLFNKYTIFEKMPLGKYFLDFAIIDMKINIEIDGQQHFRNEKSIKHDKDRDNFMKNNGWKIYRIAWIELFTEPEKTFNELLLWLDKEYISSDRYYNIDEVKLKLKKRKMTQEERNEFYKKQQKFDISREQLENLIKEKSMSEIGKMFKVSSNAIKKRCKKMGIVLEKYYWQKNKY